MVYKTLVENPFTQTAQMVGTTALGISKVQQIFYRGQCLLPCVPNSSSSRRGVCNSRKEHMKLNVVLQGDCLEFMKTLPDKCIDWIITDPPYGIDIGKMSFTSGKEGGIAQRNDYRGMADWDSQKISQEVFDEMFRISKNQIIFGGNYYTDILLPTKSWLIWDKKTEDKYRNDFADCEMAWCSTGQARVFRFLWSGMLQDNMKNKEARFHPTQKPSDLMGKIIDFYTEETDIIFDPFAGSGSTLIACQNLKRKWIGCEISPEYCAIAEDRIKAISNTLF